MHKNSHKFVKNLFCQICAQMQKNLGVLCFRKGEVLPIWKFYNKNKKHLEVAMFIISVYLEIPLPSDNFNINNKNLIPSKCIVVLDIQIKRKMDKTVKMYCCDYLSVRCIWLYVFIMLFTRFKVNPHSIFAWMSRNHFRPLMSVRHFLQSSSLF